MLAMSALLIRVPSVNNFMDICTMCADFVFVFLLELVDETFNKFTVKSVKKIISFLTTWPTFLVYGVLY